MIILGFARKHFSHFIWNAYAGEVDRRHIEHAAHANGQVGFTDVGLFNDELDKASTLLFLLFEQLLHLPSAQ